MWTDIPASQRPTCPASFFMNGDVIRSQTRRVTSILQTRRLVFGPISYADVSNPAPATC